jgi:hypothetical protein
VNVGGREAHDPCAVLVIAQSARQPVPDVSSMVPPLASKDCGDGLSQGFLELLVAILKDGMRPVWSILVIMQSPENPVHGVPRRHVCTTVCRAASGASLLIRYTIRFEISCFFCRSIHLSNFRQSTSPILLLERSGPDTAGIFFNPRVCSSILLNLVLPFFRVCGPCRVPSSQLLEAFEMPSK